VLQEFLAEFQLLPDYSIVKDLCGQGYPADCAVMLGNSLLLLVVVKQNMEGAELQAQVWCIDRCGARL
jgi:hypothetical protein